MEMRVSVTTSTGILLTGPSVKGSTDSDQDFRTVSYIVFSSTNTGTVLLKSASSGDNPATFDMSDAARWDFSKAMLTYTLEPGKVLLAKSSSGTITLDVIRGGEQ